jgi:8-oxo-dGTP diphosphatase
VEKASGRVRVRVVGLVIREESVLVVTHSNSSGSWNCFPGGQLEHGETMEACLARELNEELLLDVEVGKLVAVGTYEEGNTTSLEMYFQCNPVTLDIQISEPHILEARFLPMTALPEHVVYPVELARDLSRLISQKDQGALNYGRFS